jgi:hypothetical protein
MNEFLSSIISSYFEHISLLGTPLSVSLSATYNSITVSWAPPQSFLRHGIVSEYIVQSVRYPTLYDENDGVRSMRNNVTLTTPWTVTTYLLVTDSTAATLTLTGPTILSYTSKRLLHAVFVTMT